jgi:glyoxylase-like metal-dependent hydrolase (beta-lactamase superfamily II)
MLKIQRFVNELMTSNCYIVYDDDARRCVVIDPASEKSLQEIHFIDDLGFELDYILLTHEHTDHNWGVNALRDHFEKCKLLCSVECSKHVKKANNAYFLFYYDDPDYRYEIAPADFFVNDGEIVEWYGHQIKFILTPGHSYGSICIDIDGMLFTGDTIMPFKPYFNGRDSDQDTWEWSIKRIKQTYSMKTTIYPGHGEHLSLGEWVDTKY